jgi:hypothetical protein
MPDYVLAMNTYFSKSGVKIISFNQKNLKKIIQ